MESTSFSRGIPPGRSAEPHRGRMALAEEASNQSAEWPSHLHSTAAAYSTTLILQPFANPIRRSTFIWPRISFSRSRGIIFIRPCKSAESLHSAGDHHSHDLRRRLMASQCLPYSVSSMFTHATNLNIMLKLLAIRMDQLASQCLPGGVLVAMTIVDHVVGLSVLAKGAFYIVGILRNRLMASQCLPYSDSSLSTHVVNLTKC
ncbi:hypothetical protein E3N88_38822 [Mikania micrantha]|uniref:Uncharacterized protein n=1 Tax=Mikania micrantha TaxID=192012 RepID=A0A5N6LVX1_9ASTR|nr:hypothetical protein E3N88_38822 [Mikania micrantha]